MLQERITKERWITSLVQRPPGEWMLSVHRPLRVCGVLLQNSPSQKIGGYKKCYLPITSHWKGWKFTAPCKINHSTSPESSGSWTSFFPSHFSLLSCQPDAGGVGALLTVSNFTWNPQAPAKGRWRQQASQGVCAVTCVGGGGGLSLAEATNKPASPPLMETYHEPEITLD